MSASSPVITIETGTRRVETSVPAALRTLYLRRMLRRAIARGTTALAGALAALTLTAFVDYTWMLPRAARIVLLSLILLAALLVLAHSVWITLRRITLMETAREIERAAGNNQNALVTLAESIERSDANAGGWYMLARLERQARSELAEIDERVVAPKGKALRGACALLAVLLVVVALRLVAPSAFALEMSRVVWLSSDEALSGQLNSGRSVRSADEANTAVVIDEVRVRVVPPAYSGLSVEEISGDAPVRALAGSEIEVLLHATGTVEGASLSFSGTTNAMRSLGLGRFAGAFAAQTSGAFEARVQTVAEDAPIPIVRAVEVYNDLSPEARIVEPASDQLLRSVPAEPVSVRWAARDDLGLSGVTLKYIKSRGEGDAAKFTNGELSAGGGSHSRIGNREWQGAATLDLRRLDMQPGDTLVFWIEARDRKPSANNSGRSASVAIAIAAPELAKLNLSDLMPNEIGRFLLSQRAIIIKTEKLHGERARLSKSELVKRANEIAADQREFKNSFNDYIHLEGEAGEEEAPGGVASSLEEQIRAAEDERTSPHFHGIPEPPAGAPASVRELTYAIRSMWDAEGALVNADTGQALKHEREALARLKRAQAAVRYVPPIVAQSKPVDLKRRYAGELAEIKTRLEKLARRQNSPASASIRTALADAYGALNDLQETLNVSASVRAAAIGRARERARRAADSLVAASSGDHAATIAEAAAQLRVVETELARFSSGGSHDEYATRLAKPLALLTQAASNLFAIAESSTRANSNDANPLLPTIDARAAEYFRRLAGGAP